MNHGRRTSAEIQILLNVVRTTRWYIYCMACHWPLLPPLVCLELRVNAIETDHISETQSGLAIALSTSKTLVTN